MKATKATARKKRYPFVVFSFVAVFAVVAFVALGLPWAVFAADVYLGITSGEPSQRPKLALPLFLPKRPLEASDRRRAQEIYETIKSDLLFTRYFQLLEEGPFLNPQALSSSLEGWKALGAETLVFAEVSEVFPKLSKDKPLSGLIALSGKIYDLRTQETLLEKYIQVESGQWRKASHELADEIVFKLTGRKGIARSQIVFVNNQNGAKEIYLMDYDGAGARALTRNNSISLNPRWAPDKNRIAYTTYRYGNPDLYEIDLATLRQKPLSVFQGLNLAGAYSPSSDRMVVTLSMQKDPNLYLLDLEDGQPQRLTRHPGIDSSGTFSPDGRQIAFISDRSGNPQVYLLETGTGRTQRLTDLNWCDSPTWQPTGEWIAFAGRPGRRDPLDIYLVDILGNRLIQLTTGEGSNENPNWSPDGRFIAFSSNRSGRWQIYVMNADGSGARKISELPGNATQPHWSP